MKIRLLSALAVLVFEVNAQQTGEINYPSLGIKFSIPAGWKGTEVDNGYLMGSDHVPGFILMIPHSESSIQSLKDGAREGLLEDGIQLRLTGDFDEVGSEGIGGQFEGVIQGENAKAYIAAVVNPFGKGVTIVSATSSVKYSTEYKDLALAVAMSLKFSQPVESVITKEWRETLMGAKLTYLKSSYSSGASFDGYSTYSGYSRREEIMLCQNGSFYYSDNSSGSFDTGGGFGSMGSNDKGNGSWEVNGIGDESSLTLKFNDGRLLSYSLSIKDQKTYLNGTRYFRTYDQGCN